MSAPLSQNRDFFEGLQLIGCSVRGPAHQRQELSCQDAWQGFRLPGSRFVIVVADGLGSASHAGFGSHLATQEAAHSLAQTTRGESFDRDTMAEAMATAFRAARDAVSREADDRDRPVREFQTTLLAVAAGPEGAAAAAVGDGGIVGRSRGEHVLLVPREQSTYANETTPITSPNWEEAFRFRFHDQITAAAVFTDGLRPFVWDLNVPDVPRAAFFDQLFPFAESASHVADATRTLREFVGSEDFSRYSGDDKTLVVGRVARPNLGVQLLFGRRRAERLVEVLPQGLSEQGRPVHDHGLGRFC